MFTPMIPTVVSSWLDVLWWWTILDTHKKLLSVKNPAALQFLTQTGAPGIYYHTQFKALKSFVLPILPPDGTHTQSMSQLSQGLKIVL